jgi:hypothetical protein
MTAGCRPAYAFPAPLAGVGVIFEIGVSSLSMFLCGSARRAAHTSAGAVTLHASDTTARPEGW